MQSIFALMLCFSLWSCNTTGSDAAAADDDLTESVEGEGDISDQQAAEEPAEAGAERQAGKLYIQTSIVGGLKVYWLWLGDDGTFVADPRHGADPINYAAESADNPAGTGRYVKNGNNISVTYNSGKTENWPLEYDGNRLNTIDGYFVHEPEKMPKNYKLNGKYNSATHMRGVSVSRTWNFRPDGTFNVDGEAFTNTSEAGGNAQGTASGTYRVNGNTLSFTFANGEKGVAVIGVYKSGQNNFLVINNKLFD